MLVMQIAFTYIGTVVGAGFATGQEILQFFTAYGWWAPLTIALTTGLFIWLGTKLMILSRDIQARSYEDINRMLFGDRIGSVVSLFMMAIIICVNSVLLAGAGSVFSEHLHVNYQIGLLITLGGSYWFVSRGMDAILKLNSIVAPTMLTFTVFIMFHTLQMPNASQVLSLHTDKTFYAAWSAPLLYSAFNLAMAQAVLVPLGASIPDKKVIRLGGIWGGVLIGVLLLSGHFALAVYMPGITQFNIPMGHIATGLSTIVQFIYVMLIFSEIFTTYIADVYGITLQLHQRTGVHPNIITLTIMLFCFLFSQFGFKPLVSFLYPLFGVFSLAWLYLLIRSSGPSLHHHGQHPPEPAPYPTMLPVQPASRDSQSAPREKKIS